MGCIFWEIGRVGLLSVCIAWVYIWLAFILNSVILKESEIRGDDEGIVHSFISQHASLLTQLSNFTYGVCGCYLFVGWILGQIYPPFFCVSVMLTILLLLSLRKWQLRGDCIRIVPEITFWFYQFWLRCCIMVYLMNFDRVAKIYIILEKVGFANQLQWARTCQLDKIRGRERILLVGEGRRHLFTVY